MPNTLTITELRNDLSLTESDLDQMGTDGQVMLKTVITDENGIITSEAVEFFDTVEQATVALQEAEE